MIEGASGATYPEYMREPVEKLIAPGADEKPTVENVEQWYFSVSAWDKYRLLRMLLRGHHLLPIALGHVVELERSLGRRQLCDQPLRLLALARLYFFGFAVRRAFRRAVKPMTSPLEVEVPVWRAPGAIDGHGRSFRV